MGLYVSPIRSEDLREHAHWQGVFDSSCTQGRCCVYSLHVTAWAGNVGVAVFFNVKRIVFFFSFVFYFFYLTRHKISIALVSIECLDHVQSTSVMFNIRFTKVSNW